LLQLTRYLDEKVDSANIFIENERRGEEEEREKRPETCSYKAFCLTIVAMSNVYRIRIEAARATTAAAPVEARRRKEIVVPTQFVSSYRKRRRKPLIASRLFSGFDYFVVVSARKNSSPKQIAKIYCFEGRSDKFMRRLNAN
jgi:hypothetical protein